MSEEISQLLDMWAAATSDILSDNLTGLYLTGSLTYGDFVEGRSDIDLAVVVKQSLSAAELEAVRQVHTNVERLNPGWAKRIECSYIPQMMLPAVLPPGCRPWWGFGVLYESAPYGNEWLPGKYFLCQCSIALAGPPFRELAGPVDIRDVQAAGARDLLQEWEPKTRDHEWLDNSHFQSYLVLNLCRILYVVASGNVGSKSVAADWTRKRFPRWRSLIEKAGSWRYGAKMDRKQEAIDFVRFAIQQVNESGVLEER